MISHDAIGTKRPASRDRFGGAVRQAHHMREIERLTATNHHRQHMMPPGKAWQLFLSAIMLEQWSPNKSSLYNVKQNKRLALWEQTTNLDANDFLILTTSSRQPTKEGWWSRTGSNRRHPACKAGALPAELRPLITFNLQHDLIQKVCNFLGLCSLKRKWWAWEDLNLRPHAYQARALTN